MASARFRKLAIVWRTGFGSGEAVTHLNNATKQLLSKFSPLHRQRGIQRLHTMFI